MIPLGFQEGKRDKNSLFGRNDAGIGVVFPETTVNDGSTCHKIKPGDYAVVKVNIPSVTVDDFCKEILWRILYCHHQYFLPS